MIYDLIVVGGGPGGMSAAIGAKNICSDARVMILDKNKKLGKKLYATGNGRCNIANTKLDLSSYHSDNEFFPYQIVTTQSYKEVLKFLSQLGVESYDENGYLYPRSLQASTVVWALTDRLRNEEVTIHVSEEVMSVKVSDNGYLVETNRATYEAKQVILSPGGAAAPGLGGSDRVYGIADSLDIRIVPVHPALCRLKCHGDMSVLSGVRAKADVSLLSEGQEYDSESGEVQFADGYVSGIVVFNLSIQCIDLLRNGQMPYIRVKLLPGMDEAEVLEYMQEFLHNNGTRRVAAMLNGLVNEKISSYIVEKLGINCISAGECTGSQLKSLAHTLKNLDFMITGHGGYEESQAASGGVDTRQLRADTLELDGHKGMYAVGEYVDVTGKCGGYNIMWAVISGLRAGSAAGKRINDDKNK